MQHITAQQLQQWLLSTERPAPLLLDVREPWEYQIAHIEGAQLIPMHDIPERVAQLDQQADIVVICHHGVRSMQVAHFLAHQGFAHIYNLRGGVDAWAQSVDRNMSTY